MPATILLRKDKNAMLTWEEMDANFIALRDTPGPQGPQGIQGPPGAPGPAADASVSSMLTSDALVLTADSSGVVPGDAYQYAKTSMSVILGILDDTANWNFTKVDSAGVTSEIVDNTVTLTHIEDSTDIGTVTILANRPGGYPTLTRVYNVSKARAGIQGVTGPVADVSVSALLSSEAHVFPASNAGVVADDDYTGASTEITVILGLADDTANWDFSTIDSAGITSAVRDNVVEVTHMDDDVTTGSVIILASRSGYPTLKRVFKVAKALGGALGPAGPVGATGAMGIQGAPGHAGVRGSRTFYVPVTATTWSDSLAISTAAVSQGPVLNDTVIQYNNDAGFAQTRFWTGSSWALVNGVLNGNALVNGTVSQEKLASTSALNTQLGILWKVIANLPSEYLTDEAVAMLEELGDTHPANP